MNKKLTLGTWSLGGEHFGPYDLSNADKVLKTAYELGIRHYDTALFYAHGRSVDYLAKGLSKQRDKIFISSKGGLKWQGRAAIHDASAKALTTDCEATLKALNTDVLDLYSLHWPDNTTNLGDSIAALAKLKDRGLIKNWGLCNLNDEQIQKFCPPGSERPYQGPYNWLRQDQGQLIDYVRQSRIQLWAYSPLEQGRLATPEHRSHTQLSQNDFRHKNPFFGKDYDKTLETFHEKAKTAGLSPSRYAINWLDDIPEISRIIIGPRTISQLKDIA